MAIKRIWHTGSRFGLWFGLAILLGGCFQSASEPLAPTFAVNVTAPSLATFTPLSAATRIGPVALATGAVTQSVSGANVNATPVNQSVTATVVDQAATSQVTAPVTDAAPTDSGASPAAPATTDTPFITAIATTGFVTPDNGTALLIGTQANPVDTAAATANVVLNTPTALPSENPCTYTVRPNDHLLGIATQVNVSLEALEAANPQLAGNPNDLKIGQVLTVPGCGKSATPTTTTASPTITATATAGTPGVQSYTVQSGDSLYVISQRFNIPIASLEKANKLTDQSVLQIGQVLIIPAK